MAYKLEWNRIEIISQDDILDFIRMFRYHKPEVVSFDTESTGLNIITDKPFVITFGFRSSIEDLGYSYVLDFETYPELLNDTWLAINKLFSKAKRCVGSNIKFDLHMLSNIDKEYTPDNLVDTQALIRLTHDAIPTKKGGVSLALKDYVNKHIHKGANHYEKHLKSIITSKIKNLRRPFRQKLGITQKDLDKMVKDKYTWRETNTPEFVASYEQHLEDQKQCERYDLLPRDLLVEYALEDTVQAIEIDVVLYPIVIQKKQLEVLKRESDIIRPLFHMERVGYNYDTEYAEECRESLKHYAINTRQIMRDIAGFDIDVGQHQKHKEVLNGKFNLGLESTNKDTLNLVDLDSIPKDAARYIKALGEMRTIDKWFSTYIDSWLNSRVGDKVYTSYHAYSPVSGRLSANFHQFPKGNLYDREGNELFVPRRMFKPTGTDGFNAIFYLDYSQIELRIQAIYTMLLGKGEGDVNLCRAYMPYKCYEKDGQWYREEDDEPWTPTDMHSATTASAFPDVDPESKEFKKLRGMGKATNFACQYGANANTLMRQMHFSSEVANALYNGYRTAFPKIKDYQSYVYDCVQERGYITNLFGRRFYGASGHNCINYLIQGSGADILKMKIIETHKFLKDYKSRLIMNLHDEIAFEIHDDEYHIIPKLKEIMEDVGETPIPIVADVEITKTTWAEKEDYHV